MSNQTYTKHFPELWMTAVATVLGDHAIEFILFEMLARDYWTAGVHHQTPLYTTKSNTESASLEDVEPWAECRVKWDGCADWRLFDENYQHACNRQHLTQTGERLAACYDWAKELDPRFEQD